VASELRVDAVWDIETANWDQFAVGAMWTPQEGTRVYRSEDQLAEALLALPPKSVAWAHAGGRFDVLWLLDWCRRRGTIPPAQIRMSGSSIASLAIKRGPVLRDSCRLIPMSLKQACTMFDGVRKEALELICVCGRACGGYCSIRLNMVGPERRRVEDYLVADIESLRDTMLGLVDYASSHALDLAGTVASTAWSTAKGRCGLDDADWDFRAYKLARAGYYGGRVEVARLVADLVERFDRASAYPAALTLPVPCGAMRILDARTARLAWARQRPGIYHGVVRVADQLAPPLPVRHGARLVYPSGLLHGAWTRDELQHALDGGAELVTLNAGVAWADEQPILKPHVDHCFALRKAAMSKALKTWLKFVANALTGAFAQDPEQDVVVLGDKADDPAYEQVGRYDWIWRRTAFRISARAHVHWAATLTARARVELHQQIEHAGKDWCYSDTDSVIATRMLKRNTGDQLGQWQHEGSARDFRAIAPKVYTYTDDDGERFARAKGIPDAVREWDRIASGDVIKLDRGVKSLLVAARGDAIFARNDGQRTVKPRDGWVGARVRVGDRTRAPTVAELEQLPQ
jgi:DNA polymerase type B, organellar and viral